MAPCPRRLYLPRLLKLSACCSVVIVLWFNLSALDSYHAHRSNKVTGNLVHRSGVIQMVAEKGKSGSEERIGRGDSERNATEGSNSFEKFKQGSIFLEFGDELCALSPEEYGEDYDRKAWEDIITEDLYWKSSKGSQDANSKELSENSSATTDFPITSSRPVVPAGESFVTEYRRALAFASAKVDEAKEGDVLETCNFFHFTKEESQHVWRLAQRHVGLNKVCRRYASFFTRPLDVYNNLLWDTSSHLGYCAVFKTGTTSWMSHLVDWKGVDSEKMSDGDIHTRVYEFYPTLKPAALAEEIEEYQPLLFTVGRHPFIRVVSAYVNKILDGYLPLSRMNWIKQVRGKSFAGLIAELRTEISSQQPEKEEAASMLNLLRINVDPADNTDFEAIGDPSSDSDYLTFREFVRWIILSTVSCLDNVDCLLNIDEHWQPQYVQCSPCTMRYDVISKMETFDDDAKLIMKLVGRVDNGTIHQSGSALPPSGNARAPAKRRNISLGSSAAQKTREYLSELTAEEIRLLYVAYYLDFTLFGFSPVDIV